MHQIGILILQLEQHDRSISNIICTEVF